MGVVTEPDGPTIENMRKRAEQCRRLASAILDRRTADALIKLAEEVEADIRRLEEGRPDPDQPLHQPPVGR